MSLGERLKKARQDSGLSLKKIADQIKVQVKYLERLENGQHDKLPAPVYTRGFLNKYIQILDLPSEEILAQYQKELEIASLSGNKGPLQIPRLHSPKLIITPKTIGLFLVAITVILIVGYLIYQFDYLIAPPKLFIDYPSEDLTINRSDIEISGRSDPTAKLTINGQQVYINKDGKFKQSINLSPGENKLNIEAINRFGKKTGIIRQIIVK